MPELPEVETIRSDIDNEFGGRRIVGVEVSGIRSVRRHEDPAQIKHRVEGHVLVEVKRRGKYLLFLLDGPDALVVHLGMSGQLRRAYADAPRLKHTHVVLSFEESIELHFVDPRTFGEVFVTSQVDGTDHLPELSHLGFDPLQQVSDWTTFGPMLRRRKVRLKPLLMDQRFIVGIGNMYADEILFAARLRGDRRTDTLLPDEVGRLQHSIVDILEGAIAERGSSLADKQYRDLAGELGRYQILHQVYAREGQPCSNCSLPVVRVKANGRSSFFCPSCQL